MYVAVAEWYVYGHRCERSEVDPQLRAYIFTFLFQMNKFEFFTFYSSGTIPDD